jgi:outer membrane protein
MKTLRTLLTVAFLSVFTLIPAQEGMFGYIDFNNTLKHMPDYVDAEQKLKKIQSDYKEEIERSKREFERQYINFILEQDHLSPTIVAKRQKELQLLMDNNVEFRDKVQSELETKRDSLLNPIKIKLLEVISKVCTEQNLDYVIDIGSGAYISINQTKGVDISASVYGLVGIERYSGRVTESSQPIIKIDAQGARK